MGLSATTSQFIDLPSHAESSDTHVRTIHGAGSTRHRTHRILVVDDKDATVAFLERVLADVTQADFHGTTDPGTIIAALHRFPPDLVLLDLGLPNAEGLALLHVVKGRIPVGTYLPIVALTNETSAEAKHRILANGATDVLTKPLDPSTVQVRITHLLKRRALYLEGHARRTNAGASIGRYSR